MPRFYAACLASYTAGTLHGAWIDASDDVDAMQEEINAMLRASPHPNVMVEDPATGEQVPSAEEYAIHDYDGLPSSLGEHPGLDYIAEDFEDSTGGLSEVPERLRGYIDFAAIGRDAELGGDIRAIRSGGSLYVFWNR